MLLPPALFVNWSRIPWASLPLPLPGLWLSNRLPQRLASTCVRQRPASRLAGRMRFRDRRADGEDPHASRSGSRPRRTPTRTGRPKNFFRVAPTGGAVFLLGQLGKVKIFLAPFKVSLGDCRSRARPPSAPMHLAQKALTEPARRSRNRFLGIFRTFSQTRQKVRKPSQGPAAKHEGQLRSHPDTPTLAPAQYQ